MDLFLEIAMKALLGKLSLTGTVQYDADGNIHIVFTWTGGNGGRVHTFYGTTDGYSLAGMVNVLGGGGPGHCIGYETE
jgi:hypothetical protein